MAYSPTKLTLREMTNRGFTCEVVEHWNGWAKIRHDLFGFIDVLCLGNDEIVGVQTTTKSNMSARIKKISDHENVAAVRKSGMRILVHGWHKENGRWKLNEADIS